MALGSFGGSAPRIKSHGVSAAGGSEPLSDTLGEAIEGTWPTPEGTPADQRQIDVSKIGAAGASAATTTSATDITLAGSALDSCTLSVTVNGSQSVFLIGVIDTKNSTTARRFNVFGFFRDTTQLGAGVANQFRTYLPFVSDEAVVVIAWLDARPAQGTYTYTIHWATENAGDTASCEERLMFAVVFPDRP